MMYRLLMHISLVFTPLLLKTCQIHTPEAMAKSGGVTNQFGTIQNKISCRDAGFTTAPNGDGVFVLVINVIAKQRWCLIRIVLKTQNITHCNYGDDMVYLVLRMYYNLKYQQLTTTTTTTTMMMTLTMLTTTTTIMMTLLTTIIPIAILMIIH